jgi:hypothetical protein
LFLGGGKSHHAINEDPDGPGRHDPQADDDALGGSTGLIPHRAQVESNLALQQGDSKQIQLKEKHWDLTLLINIFFSNLEMLAFFETKTFSPPPEVSLPAVFYDWRIIRRSG